ncbi:MAG TPA: L,D-transpeptidase family protein [Gaiellaceae bacterium]|nr:L,D-transpeptidase family protein [Gaiellaceae bacterium]
MRRAAVFLAALTLAPAARAAPPAVTVQATPASGAAPLAVTLTASGDAATYHWDLGDGTTADGAAVQHTYAAGRFTARVTATNAGGETAQATAVVTATGLTLAGPRSGRYQQLARFRGRLLPAAKGLRIGLYRGGQRIATTRTTRNGSFVVRGRVGAADTRYTVRFAGVVSNEVALAVRPMLDTAFSGSGQLGRPLSLFVRERPSAAGLVTVRVTRGSRIVAKRSFRGRARIHLATGRAGAYRIRVTLQPEPGYLTARRALERIVFLPSLGPGSAGPSVYELDRRLHELHFALGRVDGYYGLDDLDAVTAFQKLHGLPRTGTVDARVWRELQRAEIPRARYPGDHVEVSKGRQVLFLVRNGKVALVVPVSTGATGNTPLGHWRVYSRVPGYNAKAMYYSSFFVGGFAIHGYASVPPYPASHGCVRIPLWIAYRVFSLIDYGTAVYIYW